MKNKYRVAGSTVVIQLKYKSKRYYTYIDLSDLPKIDIEGTWKVKKCGSGLIYATMNKNSKGKYTELKVHRIITECPKGMSVDHINRDSLDNRKKNLRVCTHQENMENKSNYRSKRPYKYVQPHSGGYEVSLRRKGKQIYLGFFKELSDAILMAKMWEF